MIAAQSLLRGEHLAETETTQRDESFEFMAAMSS
jgi:hypothetical protein